MKSFVFFSFSNLVIVVFSDGLPAMFHESEGIFLGGTGLWMSLACGIGSSISWDQQGSSQNSPDPRETFPAPLGVRPRPTEGPSSDQLLFSHRVTLDGEQI